MVKSRIFLNSRKSTSKILTFLSILILCSIIATIKNCDIKFATHKAIQFNRPKTMNSNSIPIIVAAPIILEITYHLFSPNDLAVNCQIDTNPCVIEKNKINSKLKDCPPSKNTTKNTTTEINVIHIANTIDVEITLSLSLVLQLFIQYRRIASHITKYTIGETTLDTAVI